MQPITELQTLKTTIKTNAVKFQHLDLDKCIKKLIYGSFVKKLTKKGNGKTKKTFFYLYESDLSQLRWISKNKIFRDAKIDLRTVTTVSEMPVSVKKKNITKYEKEELLSILYGQEDELILIFDNRDDKLDWWCGIEYFIQKSRASLSRSKETLGEIAHEIFHRADKDGSKGLTRDEIKNILKELQANVKKKDLNDLFARYDRDNSNTIDQMEFRELINEIFRKKELVPIFQKYTEKNYQRNVFDIPLMSLNQYLEFMRVEQNQTASIRDLKYLGDKLKNVSPDEKSLSFDDFSGLVFSINNSVFNPKHIDLYQDMNQPLTDYYINSSHNTYLLGNQLTGESSVNAYIAAINKGCRCVELDIWPGEKGEPVIYHGHTLTSKILFEDVIKALGEHSFVTSPYPMILSFEMHCDVKIQGRIAAILEQHLGDSIYIITQEEKNRKFYPSPSELKYKFIIKGKGILKPATVSKTAKPDNIIEGLLANVVFDYEEENMMTQAKSDNVQKMVNLSVAYQTRVELHRLQLADVRIKGPYASHKMNVKRTENKIPLSETVLDEEASRTDDGKEGALNNAKKNMKNSLKIDTEKANELYDKSLGLKKVQSENLGQPDLLKNNSKFSEGATTTDAGLEPENDFEEESADNIDPTQGEKGTHSTPKKEKPMKVNPELNKYYAMIGCKLNTKNRTPWHIVSLSENKILSLIKKDLHGITDTHKRFLTRGYPAGLRIDSSNYDPIPSWNIGAQIVALNFQTPDEPMLLTYAKFMANGGIKSGYLLKPEFLTHTALDDPNPIYGDQFTRVKKLLKIKVISGQQIRPDDFSTKEIIDPYVEVKIRGLEIDEAKNMPKRTHVIQDNGLNPIWADGKHDDDVTFEFHIHAPDLCTVVFYIWDDDKIGRNKIGWYAIDFKNILTGYRVIPIWNTKFQPIKFSYIFCHIAIEDQVFKI